MSSSHCSTKSKNESPNPNNDQINTNVNSYNDYLDNLESERERERRSKLLDIINWLQQRHHDNREKLTIHFCCSYGPISHSPHFFNAISSTGLNCFAILVMKKPLPIFFCLYV
ncbi:hypothetical protein GQX74_010249 [Glossina fuscipes]|nr:hypothetical protein GQX74_010249 [Glossina fuscipes]